jgi:hypothetical protein
LENVSRDGSARITAFYLRIDGAAANESRHFIFDLLGPVNGGI